MEPRDEGGHGVQWQGLELTELRQICRSLTVPSDLVPQQPVLCRSDDTDGATWRRAAHSKENARISSLRGATFVGSMRSRQWPRADRWHRLLTGRVTHWCAAAASSVREAPTRSASSGRRNASHWLVRLQHAFDQAKHD